MKKERSYINPSFIMLTQDLRLSYNPKKNWSSFMLFNCGSYSCKNLTPYDVSTKSASWLHEMKWATSEKRIIQVIGHVEDPDQNPKFILEIEDNGQGIPAHILQKVKEAFFTTKQSTKGTGLGLSIVTEIVEKHEGTLDIDSEEGQFTKVTITLPIKA